ncbi:hypothetical protein L2E82_28501 [Cichorium intybus]|uniref:Uncharacterized protein n=1 Tax=Cichorium intybus TaxID=13427 RepID=A0ACB9CVZ0_CICIN|nr:hypothetical protein L2E82_28501 [Cichorium intybus]
MVCEGFSDGEIKVVFDLLREELPPLARATSMNSRILIHNMDIVKAGVANQTTMLKGETEDIGKLLYKTMMTKLLKGLRLASDVLGIIASVGLRTKLQAILTKMALEITERHVVVNGIPLVQASDKYFWFSKPHLILHVIHIALFQNTFQIRSDSQ